MNSDANIGIEISWEVNIVLWNFKYIIIPWNYQNFLVLQPDTFKDGQFRKTKQTLKCCNGSYTCLFKKLQQYIYIKTKTWLDKEGSRVIMHPMTDKNWGIRKSRRNNKAKPFAFISCWNWEHQWLLTRDLNPMRLISSRLYFPIPLKKRSW